MKQPHIREWRESIISLIDFKWELIHRKREERLKTQGRDASYNLKSELLVIPTSLDTETVM